MITLLALQSSSQTIFFAALFATAVLLLSSTYKIIYFMSFIEFKILLTLLIALKKFDNALHYLDLFFTILINILKLVYILYTSLSHLLQFIFKLQSFVKGFYS